MAQASRSIVTLEIEQKVEEVQRLLANRRMARSRPLRQVANARSAAERQRPVADDGSRYHDRASMLLVAEVRLASASVQRVVVRNISTTGLMLEMEARPNEGDPVSIDLGNIGWTDAAVVWRVGNRIGVRFVEEIDPTFVRRTVSDKSPAYEAPTPLRRIV
jgi:hypothetical protein